MRGSRCGQKPMVDLFRNPPGCVFPAPSSLKLHKPVQKWLPKLKQNKTKNRRKEEESGYHPILRTSCFTHKTHGGSSQLLYEGSVRALKSMKWTVLLYPGSIQRKGLQFKTFERIVCPLSSVSQCLVRTDAATLTQGALLRLTVGESSLPCPTFQPWWAASDSSVVIPESRAGPLCPLSESQGIFSSAGPAANTILSALFFKRKKTKL